MRIGDACAILTGYTSRGRLLPAEQGGSLTLQLGDVSPDGHVDPDRLTRVAFDDLPERYLVGRGEVIFRSRGEPNIAVALDDRFVERAVAVLPLFVLRPKPEILLPEFLAWAINQPASQRHFDRVARGTTMRMVPRSGLEILEISAPPIETQRRIVAVDALAERERRLTILAANKRRTITGKILYDQATATDSDALRERKTK
ncbi:MAG: restriction endonuclease subunit S [Gemmatimonadetes bacterium]|nr:restriction endonuclease subunit S [Gemmatimonadota bacterium]